MSSIEIKEFELEMMREALAECKPIETYFLSRNTSLMVYLDSITMCVILKYLGSPYLEKKVKALTEIKE